MSASACEVHVLGFLAELKPRQKGVRVREGCKGTMTGATGSAKKVMSALRDAKGYYAEHIAEDELELEHISESYPRSLEYLVNSCVSFV